MGNMPIINLHRVVGFIFIAIILSNLLLSRTWLCQTVSRLRPLIWPIFLLLSYYFWRLLSVFASQNIPYSLFLVTLDILLQFVIFISVIISFNDSFNVRSGLKAILFGAVVVVIIGLIEFFSESNIFVSLVPNSSRNIEFIATAIEEKIRDNYRVQTAFMHPLVLAEYLIMVIPVSAIFLFDKTFFTRICSYIVFIGGIFVLFSTGSRSGIVVLGVEFIFYLLFLLFCNIKLYRGANHSTLESGLAPQVPVLEWYFNKKRISSLLTVSIASTALLTIFVVASYYGRDLILGRGSAETMSTVARVVQLINGISAVSNKPLLGYGPGSAPEYVGVENIASGRLTLDNYYLTVVVESGIPTLVLLIVNLIIYYLYSRYIVSSNTLFSKHSMNLISCSIIGFIIFCFILSSYEVFGIAFAIFGMVLVLYRNKVTII